MIKKITIVVALVLMLISPLSVVIAAPDGTDANGGSSKESIICTIFPFLKGISFGASGICGDVQNGAQSAVGFIKFLLSLIFVAIIIISIYVVIRAALKYIQSEGDDKKIAEAQKAIKSVFIGIAALFVGIIGIVIVLAFFNATNTVDTDKAPDSVKNILEGLK